tara:strand:- start:37 stop:876 length:840 start_codon:yes stop_codon:yes gene_type:complete
MKISKVKIWTKYFFKSFVWLILPFCLFGSIKSCSEYREAGEHFTPYSVSVRGYNRSDGTYVSPYNRRPPGGVAHDAPYKRERMYMGLLFLVSLVGVAGSVLVYTNMSLSEIKRQQKIIDDIEREKQKEERKRFISRILNKINYDFSKLYKVPSELKDVSPPSISPHTIYGGGGPRKCKFCKTYISNKTFYVSFVAVSKTHYVCMMCVRNLNSIGRSQPRSKYIDEIKYFENYHKMLNEFKGEFIHEVNSDEIEFSAANLKKIFDAELHQKKLLTKAKLY